MSRLTEYQIRALIPGMEATLAIYEREGQTAKAQRTRRRLECYRAELAERSATGNVTGFEGGGVQQTFCSQYTDSKDRSTCPVLRGSVESKNALTIAGEDIAAAPEEILELGKIIGRRQAFGMVAASCSAADAQLLKRIKDTGAYKSLGLDWERFCPLHLGADRKTVERIIANLDAYGAAYFNLRSVVRISPATYGMIAAAAVVDENTIEYDGEKISIIKGNAERITEIVSALRKANDEKEEQIKTAVATAKTLKQERDNARKAVEKTRQELAEAINADQRMFPNAGPDHKKMLLIQSRMDMCFSELLALGHKDLGTEDQGRLIGLLEHGFRNLTQIACAVRSEFGMGWNAAEPGEELAAETMHSGARNLIDEYATANRK